MRVGWFKEPWRHGLAAKGIKTTRSYMSKKYFQTLDTPVSVRPIGTKYDVGEVMGTGPTVNRSVDVVGQGRKDRSGRPLTFQTLEKEEAARRRLEASTSEFATKQELRTKRGYDVETVLSKIKDGQTSVQLSDGRSATVGFFIQNEKSLTPGEKARLVGAVNEQAILLAQAEQQVPSEYQGVLTNTTRAQLKAIVQQQKIAGRGAVAQTLADIGKGAAIGAGEIAESAGEKIAKTPGELLETERQGLASIPPTPTSGSFGFGGTTQSSQGAQRSAGGSPFFEGNPLLGGPNIAKGGGNFALGGSQASTSVKVDQYPEAKVVAKEVDELYNAKGKLSEVNLNSFKEGKEAFNAGNRERLIMKINDIEAEEQKLRDRWLLTEQTRSVLLNPRTRAATLRKEESGFSGGILFGGKDGGRAIADQTQKLNEVKRDIKNSANEAYARRVSLQNDLRRMDAKVLPVTDAPAKVTVFKEDSQDGSSKYGDPLMLKDAWKDSLSKVKGTRTVN